MRLYHTSDLHDRRHITAPLRALRAEHPGLLIDCGDSLKGSQTLFRRREPIVAAMDAAGYDVQAMGNREFNYVFGAVAARARMMHHPLICANLVDTRGRDLPFAPDWTYCDRGDGPAGRVWTIWFFGLLVPQYPVGSPWERVFGWRFRDPYELAEAYAAAVPPFVTLVALSHLGLRADRELARRVPRLDLILGGHSHDTLPEPEYVGRVPIVHAGPYGKYVSQTDLAYDDVAQTTRIVDSRLVPLAGAS